MAAVEVYVSGRVQGVGFRVWTRQQARALDLSGSAVNLTDGRVRVRAEGPRWACTQLVGALRTEAPGRVREVVVRDVNEAGIVGFTIG